MAPSSKANNQRALPSQFSALRAPLQALLEASSISARLRLLLGVLRKHRSVLTAVAAMKDLAGGEGSEG